MKGRKASTQALQLERMQPQRKRIDRPGPRQIKHRERGFTLLEALVAVALMGLLLATLGTVTAHWLPGWKAGFDRTQNTDLLGLGLDRIAADIGAAEFMSVGRATTNPLFRGTESSVTFVRSAIGPNSPAGLEIVRLAEIDDARGRILVRTRSEFTPSVTLDAPEGEASEFSNPVVLIRPPFRVSFAYAGPDRFWRESWLDSAQLPEAVRITVRDGQTGDILPASTAALINVTAPADCVVHPGQACGGQGERGQLQGGPAGGQPQGAAGDSYGGANAPASDH